ncbi:MAG: 2-hydroxychromene-2-carboxylate isomerase [Hyphomicrobiales bacterium]|nr:2-hydroxychromene-2-carboxylate isomerase [Hyphomicrobiales bacterium]
MTRSLEFIFDYGSPNAYMVHRVLPAFLARTGAGMVARPCLLGGIFKASNNKSPIVQYADIPAKLAYERLEMRRFAMRHGLSKFRMNPHFPVNTLLIMRGAIAAQELGALPAYSEAMFAGMWEQCLNLSDPEIVATTVAAAGIDASALLARTAAPEIKAALAANTEAAVARGVFGIPTFFVGNEMFFGKERLGQVEEALAGT